MSACIQARNLSWKANIMCVLGTLGILDILGGSMIACVGGEFLLTIRIGLVIAPLSLAVCGRKVVQLDKLLIDEIFVIEIQTAQRG